MGTIPVSASIELDERLISERFVRASGPGGQNVNKVASAVELRFDLRSSSLAPDVKDRIAALAGSRLTSDGVILIDSRRHRTQAQNRDAARARLVALVRQAARPPKARRPTKPTGAARDRRLAAKKQRGAVKASRATQRGGASED
jgi:ribosome-associated protein